MTGHDIPTPTTPLSDKLALVTHHHLLTRVPVKLDLDDWNYGSWEYFFEQLCSSYEVTKFLHDDSNATGTSTVTPLIPEEAKVDKIILSWIFTTLSDPLQKRLVVARPATAKAAWTLLTDIVKDNKRLMLRMPFLHGDLSETVYMHQPPGFRDAQHPDYGTDTAYLLLYVDDIVLTASSEHLLQRIIRSLHQEFAMTDLGALNYFLGISVHRDSTGIFLSQRKYAAEILERARMVNCNPCRTPVDTESKLGDTGDPVSDPTLYRSLAGSLQYLTFTRPDILYAVQQVCLYMHDPREPHFSALKRILRYVCGTLDYGLQLFSSSTTDLIAFSDADWAGCPTTRRSTSGYCVFLGNNLLSWSSKRQPTLFRSSAEAEYRGVANAVAETFWLRNLSRELHTPLSSATLVYCDNVSAVYLSCNPVQHQRTKHIEIDIHFVRDLVAAGQVCVLHVPSRY
ncbi:ribonuclease H-like domain-containing protein [Tanacetum coccineum]